MKQVKAFDSCATPEEEEKEKPDNEDLYNCCFAEILSSLMKENHTTQLELAKHTGCRSQTISEYVKGKTSPTIERFIRIADYFKVSADYLLTGHRREFVPVRKATGLSEDTVSVMSEMAKEKSPTLAILDRVLSDENFYLALQKASENMKESYRTTGDEKELHEWRAHAAFEKYFMNFFKNEED